MDQLDERLRRLEGIRANALIFCGRRSSPVDISGWSVREPGKSPRPLAGEADLAELRRCYGSRLFEPFLAKPPARSPVSITFTRM